MGAIDRIRAVQGLTWWDEAERLRALMALDDGTVSAVHARAAFDAAAVRLPPTLYTYLAQYGLPV